MVGIRLMRNENFIKSLLRMLQLALFIHTFPHGHLTCTIGLSPLFTFYTEEGRQRASWNVHNKDLRSSLAESQPLFDSVSLK